MLLTNGWIYFRLTCAGLHPPWQPPHTAPPWWLVAREAQPRAENLIPNMILQNGRSSSSCKKRLHNCPQLQKSNWCYDRRFLRSDRVKLLLLHPIYPKHPVDMALHRCYCTSHIVRLFANIRLSPECDGSQGSLRYYESGRRVFSLGSVSQNTVIIIVQPPVQHWAVSSRAVCWLWPLWTSVQISWLLRV